MHIKKPPALACCLLLVCAVLLVPEAATPHRILQTCPLKYTNEISARALQWVLQFKGNCMAAAPAAGVNVFPRQCGRHLATQRRGRRVDRGEALRLCLQLLLHRQGMRALGKTSMLDDLG